jgi:hypothetical protein
VERGYGFELHPWRARALALAALAAVELVLLIVAGVALFGRPLAGHVERAAKRGEAARAAKPAAPARTPVRHAPAAPRLARAQTSILILNGNGVAGAAGTAAARAQARGYVIAGVSDAARNDYARSVVMYRPGYAPEGRRLARDLGVRIVGPLDGIAPGELLGAHVALIVGRR